MYSSQRILGANIVGTVRLRAFIEPTPKFMGVNAAGEGTSVSSLLLLIEQRAPPSCSTIKNVGTLASLSGSSSAPSAETPVGYRRKQENN